MMLIPIISFSFSGYIPFKHPALIFEDGVANWRMDEVYTTPEDNKSKLRE